LLNVSEAKIRCRQIRDEDIGAVIELLAKGFPERSRSHWARGLERQRAQALPDDSPRYGYLLESAAVPVGIILLLCTSQHLGEEAVTRCNLSSWYVEPAFRSHASLLISFAIRQKQVTYVNISPAKHTWPIVEAHGFTCYSSGQFLAAAAVNRAEPSVRLHEIKPGGSLPPQLKIASADAGLLTAHADYGCLSLVCEAADGGHPFVFQPIGVKRGLIRVPGAQLIYCGSISDFVRFAGVLGRFLLKRGMVFVSLDANGPVEGLVGTFRTSWGRKYFKGPNAPRLGDLAYTEIAIFGP
jgi:hypothetical protein